MSDDNDLHKSTWIVEVVLSRGALFGGPTATSYETIGPAEFRIDDEKNLRVVRYLNDDFGTEVVLALHLAGTWVSVNQFALESEPAIVVPEKDVTEGGLDIDDERDNRFDYDGPTMQPGDEIQVHDLDGNEW